MKAVWYALGGLGFKDEAINHSYSNKTWNTPALAGEFLLVRNDQEAVCYKLAKDALHAEN